MTKIKHQPTDEFERFWQTYLRDHTQPLTRRLHFIGISIALAGIIAGIFLDDYGLTAVGSVAIGVAILWAAHRFVEHNQPTGYRRRLGWALVCGARMYWLGLTGRLGVELKKAGVS